MIKGSNGAIAAKTVNWIYDAETKTLQLKHGYEGNEFPLSDFNHEGGRKWYVTGMIGGSLGSSDHTVIVSPTKDLKAVSNLNDELGAYDIPYAFPWTELELHVAGEKEGNSYKEAYVTPLVTFRPQGAFIKYQLGNKQEDATKPSFTPSGFTVSSNDFGDQGKFTLNTEPIVGGMPRWIPEACGSTMTYTLLGEKPVLKHGEKTNKYYYAWVMPRDNDIVRTFVVMRGETTGETSLTQAFFTDYKAKGKNARSGRIHLISTNVSKPVYLPIEYVAEYNLAGGSSVTVISDRDKDDQNYIGDEGELRFANRKPDGTTDEHGHLNNRSGFYHWEEVSIKSSPNRDIRNQEIIDTNGQKITLKSKYRIPELDDWWGIFPAPYEEKRSLENIGFNWDGTSYTGRFPNPHTAINPLRTKCSEHMKVGDDTGNNQLSRNYTSEYSLPFYLNTSTKDGDAVVYALRFMKQEQCLDIEKRIFIEDGNRFYASAPDNSMACAYRFHRIGQHDTWEDRKSMTHHLVIEVVYLGEDVVSTPLSTISNDAWWNNKRSENKVYKLTFPAVRALTSSGHLVAQAGASNLIEYYYWSTLTPTNNTSSGSRTTMTANFVRGGYFMVNTYKLPVRLFKKHPKN
ncbi:hypothetical protein [Porphyromonas sp. COT-290 OH860]|uniref:hypothetical protein n=1 Tax=Porphyromonas sp. COT-290 OH860 TaxID=1515615 RepID=UPI001F225720|nr:hypothetical protein [Porphyromonas sp. COT-290 OH860]